MIIHTHRANLLDGEIPITACAATRTRARPPTAAPCEGAMARSAADRRPHSGQPDIQHGSARQIGYAARDSGTVVHALIPSVRHRSLRSLLCNVILLRTVASRATRTAQFNRRDRLVHLQSLRDLRRASRGRRDVDCKRSVVPGPVRSTARAPAAPAPNARAPSTLERAKHSHNINASDLDALGGRGARAGPRDAENCAPGSVYLCPIQWA